MQKILKEDWSKILNMVKEETTEIAYQTWLEPIKPLYIKENKFYIEVPTTFHKNNIMSRYNKLLSTAINITEKSEYELELLIPEETEAQKETQNLGVINSDSSPTGLNPRYIFENFVVGNSNRFAHAASLAVAEAPAKAYNPLFLYGGVGLGKTHLMHAVGHYILKQNPNQKVLYITSEKFTNDFINAIKNQGTEGNKAFRNRYRNVDVLLVDDIQFIAGKEGTQEEFFHTFNALYEANKQIIISSDKPPKDIEPLEERLRSRFEWGLTADIQAPDYETRIAILRKKAQLDRITVPDEINAYIAERIDTNIRELEGALNKVLALSNLTNQPISLELTEQALKDIAQVKTKNITINLIQDIVAKYYNVTVDDFKSAKRSAFISNPRQIAMYLCRSVGNFSLPKIGTDFGNRDHTTIIHGCNKIESDMKKSPELAKTIEELKKLILY
ncbi:MAG: chromosomal replication initiator protein DnaA [Clostridia bacterium]|nr:chromosomal replication initiator protein DnaA [Clostridia bacterium]